MARVKSVEAGSGGREKDLFGGGGGDDVDEEIRALLMADSYKGLSIKGIGSGGFAEFECEPNTSRAGGGITLSGIDDVLTAQRLCIEEKEALRIMGHR